MSAVQVKCSCARSGFFGQRCTRPRRLVAVSCDKLDYKASGVDIQAGNDLVQRIKKLNPDIGGFNGMFPFGTLPGICQHCTCS
jgi:hypothetical protein